MEYYSTIKNEWSFQAFYKHINCITVTENSANKKKHIGMKNKQTNQNVHENTQQNIPEEQK